jgi:glutathione S-transferase
MEHHVYASLVTLLAVLTTMLMSIRVGGLRGKTGVNAPDCTGNEEFERAFRIHANTNEQLILFLPSLWMAATIGGLNDLYAGIAGLAWVLGRYLYMRSYMADPKTRAMGMMMTFLISAYLWVVAIWGTIQYL